MSDLEKIWQNAYDKDVPRILDLKGQPAYKMLQNTADRFGDRPAMDFLGYSLTWRQIDQMSSQWAVSLKNLGVGKGHNVGVFLPNSPYFLVAYYAVLKAGGTVVNMNVLYAQDEIDHIVKDAGIKLILTLDLKLLYEKVSPLVDEGLIQRIIVCPFANILPFPKSKLFLWLKKKDMANVKYSQSIIHLYDFLALSDGRVWTEPEINPDEDLAVLQYTGGTTGRPKGAMLTHTNIVANAVQCRMWCSGIKEGEHKMLAVLPMFHVFAMTVVMNLSVIAGMEIIALPRFDLKDTLKAIQKKKPEHFPAVPAIYNAINNSPLTKKFDLSSLEYCIAGGAPLPVEVKKQFEEKTGCVVIEGYGLTENSPVACANPIKGENIAGSIGLPLPGVTLSITDKDDPHKTLPLGEIGELCIGGPQVMKGYWLRDDATERTIIDGMLHTGDIARIDERGYVYIVDRLKDMIITNGYNVYPRNVEEAIYQHNAVEECVVAGLPDQNRGEIVKAWIKCKDGKNLSHADLKEFLKEKISPMEIPRVVEFREQPLPKTLVGKLSRKDLLAEEKAG